MARWTSKHLTVFFLDLSEVLSIEAGPGPGDCNISNIMENNREAMSVRSRGALEGMVYGDEVEQEVSLTVDLRNETLVDAVRSRVLNAILKKGAWASAQTCDLGRQVYTLKVRCQFKDEAGNTDWIELPSVRLSGELAVAKEGTTLSISGTCNQAPKIGTAEVFA